MADKIIIGLIASFLFIVLLTSGGFLATALVSAEPVPAETPQDILQLPRISDQQAVDIASSAAAGVPSEIQLFEESNTVFYEVELQDGNTEADIKINAFTGEIVKVEQETELGRKDLDIIRPAVSEDYAKQLALANINGQIEEVEIVKSNGIYVYEIELDTSEGEVEILIDIMSGAVLSIEKEEKKPVITSKTSISQSEAEQIALARISGTVEEVEFERFRGKDAYTVEIIRGGQEVEVMVDIESGRVLGIEYDDD